jgi:predicted RNA methylase
MKQKHLEAALSSIRAFAEPDYMLEQFPTPPSLAARLLYAVGDELAGRRVADLGCGCAMLGLAAATLGAHSVVGVDVDSAALAIARANAAQHAEQYDIDVSFVRKSAASCVFVRVLSLCT